MNNLQCQPVECDNVNCHTNASNVRYWMDQYFVKSKEYADEIKKTISKDGTICNLNREVQKLQKELNELRANETKPSV
jgi:ribosomal protein S2